MHYTQERETSVLDLAEFTWGRTNGGSVAPIGSYVNLRTLCVFQQVADGAVPLDGTFCRVAPLGTESLATLATVLNTTLGTTYTAGSLHACAGGDTVFSPGQASNDA